MDTVIARRNDEAIRNDKKSGLLRAGALAMTAKDCFGLAPSQ